MMIRLISVILVMGAAASAFSSTATYTATVTKTMVDGTNYGGCMAFITPTPGSKGLTCPGSWVSFSCSGEFNTKAVGSAKLSAAQLALVTGNKINVVVDDTKKHNGYCYARRVDNLAN